MNSGFFLGILLVLPGVNASATDLGIGSSMQCQVVSKANKVARAARAPASDLGKLRAFSLARKVCNKEYAGSYPVNFANTKSSGKLWVEFDCQSCFTFSNNSNLVPRDQKVKTITGRDPEEAWLSTVAEAR